MLFCSLYSKRGAIISDENSYFGIKPFAFDRVYDRLEVRTSA